MSNKISRAIHIRNKISKKDSELITMKEQLKSLDSEIKSINNNISDNLFPNKSEEIKSDYFKTEEFKDYILKRRELKVKKSEIIITLIKSKYGIRSLQRELGKLMR